MFPGVLNTSLFAVFNSEKTFMKHSPINPFDFHSPVHFNTFRYSADVSEVNGRFGTKLVNGKIKTENRDQSSRDVL